jgi:hypothetical protein
MEAERVELHVEVVDLARTLVIVARDVMAEASRRQPTAASMFMLHELMRALEENANRLAELVQSEAKVVELPQPDACRARRRTSSGSLVDGTKEP